MQLPADATRLWKFAYVLTTILRPCFFRFRVQGRENVPLSGGFVLASNHPGGIDVFCLGLACPRQIYYMAKHELFQIHPWFSALLRGVGTFPIRRGQRDAQALNQAVYLLHAGKVLGMFPEGTRNRGHQLRRGKSGTVRLALQAGVPVVPAAVIGVPEVHQHWLHPLHRPLVSVQFGEPMWLEGEPVDSEALQQGTEQVMLTIASMLPLQLRGDYIDRIAERHPHIDL